MNKRKKTKSFKLKRGRWDRTLPIWKDWRSKCQNMTDDQVGYWLFGCFLLIGWIMDWDTNKEFLDQMRTMVLHRTRARRTKQDHV